MSSLPPNNKNSKKKKFDFIKYKTNTINSLNEVENFLRNFNNLSKYLKLYKILKLFLKFFIRLTHLHLLLIII